MNDNRRGFIKKSLSYSILGFFAPYLAKSQNQEFLTGWYSYIFDDYYWMKRLSGKSVKSVKPGRPAKLLMCRSSKINADMILDFTYSYVNPPILMWEEKFGKNIINIKSKIINVAVLPKKTIYYEKYGISSWSFPIKVEFEVL